MSLVRIVFRTSILWAGILPLATGIAVCQAPSQGGLKTVDNPSGGQFVYGSLTGQSSKVDALVYMLHQVHGHFGDRPQIGKFFQARDGSSLAVFFTANAKTMGGQPIAGLVIISTAAKGDPQAAVLYDYAKRFVSTEPAMLQSLSTAWQGSSASPGGISTASSDIGKARPSAGPERLTKATAGDRSAVIGLPAGWQITGVAGGQLTAEGSHGEMVGLGLLYQGIIDPRSPQAQNLARMPNYNRTPHLVCPLTNDLFSAYVSVVNQVRRNSGKSPGTFNLISSKNLAADGGPILPLQAIFTVDLNDGIGPRKGSARIGVIAIRGSATWAMTVSTSNIPVQYAESEAPTLTAVINSYSQDASVIARESAADMARIHADGERARIQGEAIDARREASNKAYEDHRAELNQNSSSFDEHMGNIDWSSKVTQDYILDRSVVKDNELDGTATVGNRFADSLVKANPNRFEIVQNQDLIRGRDY